MLWTSHLAKGVATADLIDAYLRPKDDVARF